MSSIATNEIFDNGFPPDLKETARNVMAKLPLENYKNLAYFDEFLISILNGNEVIFPYRIYFSDIELDGLSCDERMVLHCIYSRHHDGYIREKHVRAILAEDFPAWVIPYLVKVSDEYIVEILEVIYDKLKGRDTDDFKAYCTENRNAFCKSYNRMVSYWNEFYRNQHPDFKNYVGRKLFIECFGAKRNRLYTSASG